MRRRRRMAGRRRRPVQWVAGNEAYVGIPHALNSSTPSLMMLVGTYASGASPVGIEPPIIGRFTVERIRGQCVVSPGGVWAQGDVAIIGLGIIVLNVPAGGTVVSIPDPNVPADADKSWLWLAHYSMGTEVPNVVENSFASMMDVDVKVRRVLRPDQRLYLIGKTIAVVGTGAVNLYPFVRTLISRVA